MRDPASPERDPVPVPESAEARGHARREYLPRRTRRGVALCLSGGGFRAALFHLGALRRLNEVGLLSQVDTITAASGGSIVAAHLAHRLRPWPVPGTAAPDWDRRVAAPLHAFVKRNLRTRALLHRLHPRHWLHSSAGVEGLAAQYERHLTPMRLADLPDRPRFVFCATDLAFGVNWVFDSRGRGRAGDYAAGYARLFPEWSVGRAVAASSCFPPVFNPLPVGLGPHRLRHGRYRRRDRAALIAGLRLTDGGLYDNLALEPVWKDHRVVLVSDGGGTFDPEADRGLLRRLARYVEVADRQARALRKRWLIAGFITGAFSGAYWGIGSTVAHYRRPGADPDRRGYPEALVRRVIAEVRTDMDAFSDAEIAVLENHGYQLADAAIAEHVAPLADSGVEGLRITPHPAAAPHPEWRDPDTIRWHLARSDRRTLLGRGLFG